MQSQGADPDWGEFSGARGTATSCSPLMLAAVLPDGGALARAILAQYRAARVAWHAMPGVPGAGAEVAAAAGNTAELAPPEPHTAAPEQRTEEQRARSMAGARAAHGSTSGSSNAAGSDGGSCSACPEAVKPVKHFQGQAAGRQHRVQYSRLWLTEIVHGSDDPAREARYVRSRAVNVASMMRGYLAIQWFSECS